MGERVERIESAAFMRCEKLESIEIPESVSSLGEDVLWGCESLCKIHISPVTIKKLGASCVRKALLSDSVLCAFLRDSFVPDSNETEQLILAELNVKKHAFV